MQKKLYATPALATLVALPLAGYTTYYLLRDSVPFAFNPGEEADTTPRQREVAPPQAVERAGQQADSRDAVADLAPSEPPRPEAPAANLAPAARAAAAKVEMGLEIAGVESAAPAPMAEAVPEAAVRSLSRQMAPADGNGAGRHSAGPARNRDRIATFDTNPVRSTQENPVSTFSIDVDTASYSFVRRSLKEGTLPQADTVRSRR